MNKLVIGIIFLVVLLLLIRSNENFSTESNYCDMLTTECYISGCNDQDLKQCQKEYPAKYDNSCGC